MQIMPINNVAFKSYICNHFSQPGSGEIRTNAWDELVNESRKAGSFETLDKILTSIHNNGDTNILAFERHCSGKELKNSWTIALYENEEKIRNDRSYLTKELSSINQNAIIIKKFDEAINPERNGYYIRDLQGNAIVNTSYRSGLDAAIVVLSTLSDKSSEYFKRLSSDLFTEPKSYLSRFAKKIAK